MHVSSKCQYLSCPAHGRGGDRPSRRRVDPGSTMTDGQWALLAPLLRRRGAPAGAGAGPRSGTGAWSLTRSSTWSRRIAWPALPADVPPHQTVSVLFRRWIRARAWCRIYAALPERARLADGRGPVPTAAVIDSQTVRAADTVPTASSGDDGGNKLKGRKRHVAVDTGGLLLVVVVTTAFLPDRDGAFGITVALREAFSMITLMWADAGYPGRFVRDAGKLWDLAVAIVKRPTRPRALSCSTAAGSWNAASPG